MRIGFGYDIHCFAPERKLVLGGVMIPFELGLKGHSDADVLIHAICDALLGAAALGDIGIHFPDYDPKYEGASSLTFLRTVKNLLQVENYEISNIDATLVLERPRISPFISDMRQAMAEALGIEMDRISVKATTNEGLGAIGRLEGCAAYAVACLQPVTPDHTR